MILLNWIVCPGSAGVPPACYVATDISNTQAGRQRSQAVSNCVQ